MNRGVIYYLAKPSRHDLLAVVAMWRLRRYYQGPLALLATQPSHSVLSIASDERLACQLVPIPLLTKEMAAGEVFYRRARTDPFPREMVTKAGLVRETPFEQTIYMDADTLPFADPSLLFDLCPPRHALMATCELPRYEARLHEYAKLAKAEHLIPHAKPVRSSVLCYWKDAPLMHASFWLTMAAESWDDEMGLCLLHSQHPHVIVSDDWNWHPMLGKAGAPKIAHSPGGKMTTRPIRAAWLAALREVWENDAGGVRQWGKQEAEQWLAQV